jgi:hypothetical protein
MLKSRANWRDRASLPCGLTLLELATARHRRTVLHISTARSATCAPRSIAARAWYSRSHRLRYVQRRLSSVPCRGLGSPHREHRTGQSALFYLGSGLRNAARSVAAHQSETEIAARGDAPKCGHRAAKRAWIVSAWSAAGEAAGEIRPPACGKSVRAGKLAWSGKNQVERWFEDLSRRRDERADREHRSHFHRYMGPEGRRATALPVRVH